MSDDEPKVLVPKDMLTLNTDDRGRAYLGTEYADQTVTVAVIKTEEDG